MSDAFQRMSDVVRLDILYGTKIVDSRRAALPRFGQSKKEEAARLLSHMKEAARLLSHKVTPAMQALRVSIDSLQVTLAGGAMSSSEAMSRICAASRELIRCRRDALAEPDRRPRWNQGRLRPLTRGERAKKKAKNLRRTIRRLADAARR